MKSIILAIIFLLCTPSQAYAWVINSNFEGGAVGKNANGDDGFSGGAKTETKYSNERARSGKQSAKSTIFKGSEGFSEWGGLWNFPKGLSEGDEVWYKVWAFYPDDFDFSCGCSEGIKFMRLGSKSGSWDYYLVAEGAVMATGVNSKEFYGNHPWPYDDIRKIGGAIEKGSWHAYEHYIKLSSTSGKGIIRAWKDGDLIFEDKITATLASSSSVVDHASIWTYWNNFAPKTQSAYIDDVTITNEMPSNIDAFGNRYLGIGGAAFKAEPNPPEIK